eukprot:300850_1
MSQKVVTYLQFQQKYKLYHPHLKYKEARLKYDKLWYGLKTKHDCDWKSHKKNVQDMPTEFHKEAATLIAQWKIKHEEKQLKSRKFFMGMGGLYKDKKQKRSIHQLSNIQHNNNDKNKKK